MIKRAAELARKAHEGKYRKGSRIPYITHPLETAVIVLGITEDPEVIAAALLHDSIEDTGVTYEMLLKEFGERVASLVLAESENKFGTWKERKSATIARIHGAPREVKILCLGDKLSNMRTTASDMLLCGDMVWEKFNMKEKREHEWYYRSVFAELSEFSGYPAYMEFERLLNQVFGA